MIQHFFPNTTFSPKGYFCFHNTTNFAQIQLLSFCAHNHFCQSMGQYSSSTTTFSQLQTFCPNTTILPRHNHYAQIQPILPNYNLFCLNTTNLPKYNHFCSTTTIFQNTTILPKYNQFPYFQDFFLQSFCHSTIKYVCEKVERNIFKY